MTASDSHMQPPALARGRTSRPKRLVRLARKEIRESLRDRRTLMTLVMMPLIVYPLLGLVVQRFAVARINPKSPEAIVLIDERIPPNEAAMMLRELPVSGGHAGLSNSEDPEVAARPGADTGTKPTVPEELKNLTQGLIQGAATAAPRIRIEPQQFAADSVQIAVRSGAVDVGILLVPGSSATSRGIPQPETFRIVCREGDSFSERAAAEVEVRVRENRDSFVRSLMVRTQFGSAPMFLVRRLSLAAEGPQESPLSAFVPLMLVLMTMTGAVYPAIDLTAGERERGTLEMLMAAPVARSDLLIGKFVAVFLVAVLTAIINLIAMVLTLTATGFDRILFSNGAGPLMFVQVLLLLVVFASFFSAVLLSVTSFARSFREAQAWLIPLMLISLAPGILSLMPGVRLTPALSLVPLVNIVLLGKELFQGIASPALFLLTLIVTAGYSFGALLVASRIFGNDAILYTSDLRSETGSGRRVKGTQVPVGLVLKCLAVVLPALVVLSGLRGRLVSPDNAQGQLLLSAGLLVLLFAIVPAVFLRQASIRLKAAWSLNSFAWTSIPGAVLLGLFTWTVAYELLILGSGLKVWQDLMENPALKKMLERLLSDTPLPLQILCLALVPAVCEELFFRGVFFNGLTRGTSRWWWPLLISSGVFAAAHAVTDASMSLARLPGTFLLGTVLGLVRIRTGSVIPGMVMHFTNNALLLSLTSLAPTLSRLGLDLSLENQAHLPLSLLMIASVSAGLGFYLTGNGMQRNPEDTVRKS